jgi:ferredoxin
LKPEQAPDFLKEKNCRRKSPSHPLCAGNVCGRVKFKLQMNCPFPLPPSFSVRIVAAPGELVAAADQTVLLSALAGGHALTSSCRNGVCRSCMCRLRSGRVTYRMAWPGLSAEEKAEGLFLPCVAYPASDLLIETAEPGA